MCFSAQASFISAFALLIVFLATWRSAHTKSLKLLSLTILFFAIQQAGEGIVWITLMRNDSLSLVHLLAMYSFMFFAGIFWPIWIPAVLYNAEDGPQQKKKIVPSLIAGSIFAGAFIIAAIKYGLSVSITNNHLQYLIGFPDEPYMKIGYVVGIAVYAIAVIIPLFVCSIIKTWWYGALVALGFIISALFFYATFGSVWCYFAAVSSALIYFIIKKH